MKNKITKNLFLLSILVAIVFMASCGNSEEKKKEVLNPAATNTQAVATDAKTTDSNDVAVSVDGSILKKSEVEKEVKEKLDIYKDKIPADKVKEVQASVKKQIIEDYVMRTLMVNEVQKRKIAITDKELKEATDQIKANLPPDKKLEDFLKENKIKNEDIALGIKVRKMIVLDLGKKAKPTQKEISKFYEGNKDKFIVPESVHVRHILVAFAEGDDDKVKDEKKTKIEGLRKKLVEGADFAETAKNNSDCPSKENGGDLGLIKKGQTVKPFEDAAFSQGKNVIGPIVTTEYGHHIIQVLEHNQPKTVSLEEAKAKIASYLEQQKQSETFNALLKKLREKAKIVIYEN
jgi:peptidyl-prolyl cis-trans isomerase C